MKKILTLVACLSLVASLAVGGSIAYLTSTDSVDNTMTLGNVKIEQIEQEWNSTKSELQDFTQDKPLLPYVGSLGWENTEEDAGNGAYRRFTMNNVVDKYVSVKNTGSTPAYVRTIIALEMGSYDYDNFNVIGVSINKKDGTEFKFEDTWNWTDDFVATIGGKNYNIMVAVHEKALEKDETTIPSLLQVYMKPEATNEDVKNLDGNGNGKYDILVVSQAVQAAGFDNAKDALDQAFGKVSVNSHPWMDRDDKTDEEGDQEPDEATRVSNSDELVAAFAKGGKVKLTDNIAVSETIVMPDGNDVILDMNGKTLTIADSGIDPMIDMKAGSSLVMTGNGTIDLKDNYGASFIFPRGDVTIENGNFLRGTGGSSSSSYGSMFVGINGGKGKLIIKDGYFDAGYFKEGDCFNNCRTALNCSWGQYIRVYGGTFVGQNPAWGDEGMADLCPHCTSTYCQGIFLEGQTKASTELPEGYTITEGTTNDGRPTYTVNYSK